MRTLTTEEPGPQDAGQDRPEGPQSGSKPALHTSRGKEPRLEMERGP